MKPKHYLVHLIRQHKPKRSSAADTVREEIRKTLSKEQFTAALKKRLLEKRKREALIEQLQSLERELQRVHTAEHDRLAVLRARIERLKKKV